MLPCRPCLCLSALLLPVLTGTLALAQAPSANTPAVPSTFSAEPYVIDSSATVVSMHADGTGTRLQTFAVHIQSDSALRSFGIVSIAYPRSSESAEFVYARARHADGTIQPTPTSDAIEQPAPVTREAPFYSDIQVKQLPIKNLSVGDTLEWQARTTIQHPEVPGQFWGQETVTDGVVSRNEVFELRTPLSVHPTIWTNPRSKVTFAETTEGSERVDRWSHSDLRPTVGPTAEAAKLAEEKRVRTPEEQLDLTEGKLPTFAWTTFPDWATVGAWYRDLSTGRATPDAAIKARVADLTAGKSSDLDKAQALYTYVSSQIRYIGVAFGIGRFQPHTAAEIFANQYGDCKDKYTLLAAMFTAAGLHSDPALIGAGIRFNPAVPSPAAFNHLISHLTLDGHEVWLDPTTEVAPWRALVPVIRDQQALVIPLVDEPAILRTPADLPYAPFSTSVVTGALDTSLNSDSAIVLTFHDDNEIGLRAVLRNISAADYGTFAQNLMANLGFGGTTSEAVIDHLTDPSQPLVIRFHYHRTRDASWGDNRITATFQPIGLPAFSPDKPPVSAIQLGVPRSETSTVAVALPTGWQVELPEAVHAHTSFANVDVTFRRDNGKLLEERKLTVLKKEVPVADFKQYQSWYEATGASGYPFHPADPARRPSQSLRPHHTQMHRRLTPLPDRPILTPKSSSPTPQTSYAQWIPMAPAPCLNRQRPSIPPQRGLWGVYAGIASQFGAGSEAVEDLQRELSYHPEEVSLYAFIGQEQQRRGDRDAALVTYRKWAAAAPSSPEAATSLVYGLSQQKQYGPAAEAGTAAIARLSQSPTDLVDLRMAVADAQLHSGAKAAAAASVLPLLDVVTDPYKVNGITYTLAEGDRNLPAAEIAQRRAIASLEAQTSGWTLNESPGLVNRQQNTIAAAWDTLGWILYHEARYPEALAYIEPAARVLDHPDIHDHLVALATALHNPALAHTEQQKLRTLSLGPAKGRHGTAELRLLVVDGSVSDIGPFSVDQAVTANSSYKPGLTDGPALLKAADLHRLLPPGSNAHLIRSGIVNCFSTVCQVILIPIPN